MIQGKKIENFIPLLYFVIRFSLSGIRANYETLNQIALSLLYVFNSIKHNESN